MRINRWLIMLVSIALLVLLISSAASVIQIEVHFSPNGGCAKAIEAELSKAEETIDIAMYYFSSEPLARTVVKAKERGVKIRVYLDGRQRTEEYSESKFLEDRGIKPRFEPGPGLMHNKFCIIDGKVVLTGSYNWTVAAEENNNENLLIIRDSDTAKIFAKKFEELWTSAVPEFFKYVGNKRTRKFHKLSCKWAKKISFSNRIYFHSIDEAKEKGYIPCKVCKP